MESLLILLGIASIIFGIKKQSDLNRGCFSADAAKQTRRKIQFVFVLGAFLIIAGAFYDHWRIPI
ncbi:MAG: hypothetical protein HRU19_21010 [Pseudobacteriovorax sp.]|nr:hypothetical protein [Pseudobacteriovorax sp.]